MTDLISEGRKRANDPVQEHLREHKDKWNQSTKKLIDAFKALKKGINGYPLPELGIGEKSKITEPIPAPLETAGDQLESYFQQAFSDLQAIINEQEQYAQYREQEKEKRIKRMEEGAPAESVVATSSANFDFTKEASNPFGRAWTYLKTPFIFGDKDRWIRKELLSAAVDLEDELIEIESLLVSNSDDAIPQLIYSSKSLVNSYFDGIADPLYALAAGRLPPPQLSQRPSEGAPAVDLSGVESLHAPMNPLVDEALKGELPESRIPESLKARKKPSSELNNATPEDIKTIELDKRKEALDKQRAAVVSIDHDANHLTPKAEKRVRSIIQRSLNLYVAFGEAYNARDLEAAIKIHSEAISYFNNHIETIERYLSEYKKEASSLPTRWLSRQWLSLFKNPQKRLLLTADKQVRAARALLNSFMDVVETKNANVEPMIELLISFSNELAELLETYVRLGEIYNERILKEQMAARSKGKHLNKIPIKLEAINHLRALNSKLKSQKLKTLGKQLSTGA